MPWGCVVVGGGGVTASLAIASFVAEGLGLFFLLIGAAGAVK